MMNIIYDSYPKAKKEHTCMWCNGKIKKGEIYHNQVIKGDYLYVWKNHEKCSGLYLKLGMYDNDDGYGIDSESFMQSVYEFLYSKLCEKEYDVLFGENAVNKAIEILESEGE